MSQSQGIYFIASDRVIDLAIAFLNSVRMHHPSIAICLIPFNDDCDRLLKLRTVFNFSVFDDPERLDWCDRISEQVIGSKLGHFRKLATWAGPFEEFIYIDIDTVLLTDLSFVFKCLADWDIVPSHSDLPGLIEFVWNRSIDLTGALSQRQIEYAANTGFMASRKGVLTQEYVNAKLPSALALKEHMCPDTVEQPFLNYLIVVSPLRYTSLHVLRQETKNPEIKLELWAGRPTVSKAFWLATIVRQILFLGFDPQYFLIHWAGEWQRRPADTLIHKVLKKLKLTQTTRPAMRYRMPFKRLWQSYRNMNADAVNKALMEA